MGRTIIGIGNAIGAGRAAASGPQPIKDDWLWFKMTDGGTITLSKTGAPTEVTLEVSLDNGATWSEWVEVSTERTHTLAAGQVMHVRNSSATETGFSTAAGSYYHFSLSETTEAGGDLRSLICKTPSNATGSAHVYRNLFDGETNIIKAPDILIDSLGIAACIYIYRNCINLTDGGRIAATTISNSSLRGAFAGCTSLDSLPELHFETAAADCCRQMAQGSSDLKVVKIHATDISAANCIYQWLYGVAPSGDFYCPSTLTIPTGASGIPTGWTRHDI